MNQPLRNDKPAPLSIPVTLTQEEMDKGVVAGKRRHRLGLDRDLRNAHGIDPTHSEQVNIEGCQGEIAVGKLMGWPVDFSDNVGHPDFPKAQVRQTNWTSGKLCVHKDDKHLHLPFILVTGRGPRFMVRGWMTGHDAILNTVHQDIKKGYNRPAHWVPQELLEDIRDLFDD